MFKETHTPLGHMQYAPTREEIVHTRLCIKQIEIKKAPIRRLFYFLAYANR